MRWIIGCSRDREAIGHFQHGFGRSGFVRVQGRVEVVDRPGIRNDAFGGCGIGAPGIGEGGGRVLQAIEVANSVLICNGEHQDLAAFFAVADGENTYSRRSGGKGAAVGIGFGGVHKLARRARDSAEKVYRGRHGRRLRQV